MMIDLTLMFSRVVRTIFGNDFLRIWRSIRQRQKAFTTSLNQKMKSCRKKYEDIKTHTAIRIQ